MHSLLDGPPPGPWKGSITIGMQLTAPLRAAFHTLGCKTNHYETDAVAERFRAAGFQLVGFDEPADVYVLNTCTVTAEADRKSRQFLRRARTLSPEALVVAMGCHVELTDESSVADIVVGTRGKTGVLDRVLAHLRAAGRLDGCLPKESAAGLPDPCAAGADATPAPAAGAEAAPGSTAAALPGTAADADAFEEFGPVVAQSETRAHIKIEDGCDSFCTYCAIPFARGRVRSRAPERVLEEAARLAEAGFCEIVLTGIHICSYGADRGQSSHALPELAARIGSVPGIARIRFGSLEPQSITPEFAERAAAVRGLCPHFHLSLQSGSDDVLRRMGRHYDRDRFRLAARLLRERFPGAALTTDVMVGFPGETEAMHRESLDFVREIGFSRLHVFRYSRRAGTAAADMPDQVPPAVSARRSAEMQALGAELALAFHRSLLGHPQAVLVEQVRPDGTATGYTPTYVPVCIEPAAGLSPNDPVMVEPLRCDREFLFGRPTGAPDQSVPPT